MKEKGEFLREYRITEEEFKAADISWEILSGIYEDYVRRKDELAEVREELSKEIFEKPREASLHSVYWRIKEPEHLIAKIIRKKNSNYRKYRAIDENNYWKIVRDLLGFRGLIIFREEWPSVHQKILERFKDDHHLHIPDDDYGKFDQVSDHYFAEPAKANVREGDDISLYKRYLGSENIIRKQNYRSVHYILKYQGYCVELQIRTLFEEALAEMDHKLRYPAYVNNEKLNQYAASMNHLVGLADELGSFYMGLAEGIKKETGEFLYVAGKAGGNIPDILDTSDKQDMRTPNACLVNILQS